jgi:putative DNA primase/helicase
MPEGIDDRASDAWEPLMAIADVAGGEWKLRGRDAALALAGDREAGGDTIGTMLLADCKAAFKMLADTKAKTPDRIASNHLVVYLTSLEDRPWPEYKSNPKAAPRPLSTVQLARLLGRRKFEIFPETIRFDEETTAKGYYLSAFEDAFERYLPVVDATSPPFEA